ncbi:hypothetical protein BJY01DRAFT_242038 [Aspergillus pseudoustus]|uniref:Uncharacterized protein n=1 Tax=Aspergillus pseudoustus TaxID=1810923 RepID=A0ABR4L3B3_9EURO
MVNHSGADSESSEAQHRQRHGSRRGSPATVSASESQVSPPEKPPAAPSGQDLGEPSPATTHRHDTDTIPANSDRHEPNSNRKYMPIGARRLYDLSWEALINELPGLHGDGTGDSHGNALAEARQALEDYKMSLLATEDEHWEDGPSTEKKTKNVGREFPSRRRSI